MVLPKPSELVDYTMKGIGGWTDYTHRGGVRGCTRPVHGHPMNFQKKGKKG